MTAQEWLDRIKSNPSEFNAWLQKQYEGELSANTRLRDFAAEHLADFPDQRLIVEHIAAEEARHARWIGTLLHRFGITPDSNAASNRYWRATIVEGVGIESADDGFAIAAHAERMRLERIRAIAASDMDHLIVSTFQQILRDELTHELIFRSLASDAAMAKHLDNHTAGRLALGLEP